MQASKAIRTADRIVRVEELTAGYAGEALLDRVSFPCGAERFS